jgi:archaeal flagellin FlaB
MTGLETAIILIAFVTIAAAFSYAVLSAGLFTVERDKETVYSSLNEASSSLGLSGSMIGMGDSITYNPITILGTIKFNVKNSVAGVGIDMTPNADANLKLNTTRINLITKYDYITNVQWTFTPIGNDNGNNLLEPGEQFEINIDFNNLTPAGCPLTQPDGLLKANDDFTLEIKPQKGTTLKIKRHIPAAIEPYFDMH